VAMIGLVRRSSHFWQSSALKQSRELWPFIPNLKRIEIDSKKILFSTPVKG
jgi:hypothetical protein